MPFCCTLYTLYAFIPRNVQSKSKWCLSEFQHPSSSINVYFTLIFFWILYFVGRNIILARIGLQYLKLITSYCLHVSQPKSCMHFSSPPIRSTRPTHLITINWSLEQSLELLIMHSSPFPCYLVSLRTKYRPQLMFFSQRDRPSVTPTQKKKKNTIYFNIYILR